MLSRPPLSFVYDYITVDKIDAERELGQVCGFLKKANIRHWLSSGTLLGIYRDGKFLEGDTDIDIGIRGEDVDDIRAVVPWECRAIIREGNIWQSVFKSPRSIAIDLMWFWEDGDKIINRNTGGYWGKPKFKIESVEFKGVKYPCPPPEWYLEGRFKTWKTRLPKEGKDWTEFAGKFLERHYEQNK